MQIISNLHNWVSELPDHIRAEIDQKVVKKTFKKGEMIYAAGDESNHTFQIEQGSLKICNYNNNGQEVIITILKDGDCLGEIGVMTSQPRINYAIASSDEVIVKKLVKKDLEQLALSFPEIGIAMSTFLCYRLQYLFNLLEDAYLLPLYDRVVGVILRLMAGSESTTKEGFPVVDLISHEAIGQMTGSARQSVGRELKKLEAEKLIKLEYGKLIVLEQDKLSEIHDKNICIEQIVPFYQSVNS